MCFWGTTFGFLQDFLPYFFSSWLCHVSLTDMLHVGHCDLLLKHYFTPALSSTFFLDYRTTFASWHVSILLNAFFGRCPLDVVTFSWVTMDVMIIRRRNVKNEANLVSWSLSLIVVSWTLLELCHPLLTILFLFLVEEEIKCDWLMSKG